jgi:hypothetical protein
MVYDKAVLSFPIQEHIEQVLNAYALKDLIMVSHDSSINCVRKSLKEFLIRIPEMTEKVKKRKFVGDGSKQFLKVFEMITK